MTTEVLIYTIIAFGVAAIVAAAIIGFMEEPALFRIVANAVNTLILAGHLRSCMEIMSI